MAQPYITPETWNFGYVWLTDQATDNDNILSRMKDWLFDRHQQCTVSANHQAVDLRDGTGISKLVHEWNFQLHCNENVALNQKHNNISNAKQHHETCHTDTPSLPLAPVGAQATYKSFPGIPTFGQPQLVQIHQYCLWPLLQHRPPTRALRHSHPWPTAQVVAQISHHCLWLPLEQKPPTELPRHLDPWQISQVIAQVQLSIKTSQNVL